jgi:eukaryotic-like serine/threonine-protein kinase
MASASALTLPAAAPPVPSGETQAAARPPEPPLRPPAPPPAPRRRTHGALPPVTPKRAAPEEPAPPEPPRRAVPSRPRTASSERLPRATGSFQARPAQSRPPTSPAEEEREPGEFITRPQQVLPAEGEAAADTNETLLPEDALPEDEQTNIITSSYGGPGTKKPRGRWLLFTGVAALLAGGGAAAVAVALGWNLGHVEALWAEEAPPERGLLEPLAGAKPAPPPPPAPEVPPAPEAPTEALPPVPTGPAPAGPPQAEPPPGSEPEAREAGAEAAPEPLEPPPLEPPRPSKRARKDKDPKPAAAPPAPPATAGMGSLTLVTEPYAKVYLGKRFLGETPFFNLDFQPGRHSLRLVHPNGKNLRLAVEVKSGENSSIRVTLDQLAPD